MSAGAASGALHIVLTMRGIRMSKRRLESALSEDERAKLNRWLLARTLNVVAGWLGGLTRCVMVSACAEALAVARAQGALAIEEPGGALGHNHAAAVGVSHAVARGAGKVMLLPCDLPLLADCALDAFAALSARADLVLAPDRHGTGTNALIVEGAAGFEFAFGDDSLARYRAWARDAGWTAAICARPELGFDLDTPDDLKMWYGIDRSRQPDLA